MQLMKLNECLDIMDVVTKQMLSGIVCVRIDIQTCWAARISEIHDVT
jgi:hypothetical protein